MALMLWRGALVEKRKARQVKQKPKLVQHKPGSIGKDEQKINARTAHAEKKHAEGAFTYNSTTYGNTKWGVILPPSS